MGGARSPSPNTIEENKAFVRGLTEDCNEEMISQVFSKYGRVTEVYLARDFETKAPRGFAFVTFESNKDCEDACKALNGKEFRGKPLHVERSAKPKGSGSSRGYRGGGRGRSGYVSRGGRSPPPHSSKDYDYKSRPTGSRDDRTYSRGGHRPYSSRGGRTRGPSPPLREYDYHTRSPAILPPKGEKYYADAVASRDRYYRDAYDLFPKGSDYPRSRYDLEYRAARPRHDYSPPPPRRDYDAVGRSYPPLPPREYYDYAPVNGRYSPVPPRRDYESSRAYDLARHDAYGYRPNESSKGYGGAYSSRIGSSYARNSPPRPATRDYPTTRESGAVRRPAVRSISPPPKRMKTAPDNYERRSSPQRGGQVSSRRF